MSATAAALVKAAILALTDENTRKKIGWVLAAILSPVILLIAFLCALGSGTASHNLSVVELCFYGGKVPSETPDEYRAYIEEMRAGFNLLDGSIENINELTEGEDGLDEIRVKALFYALYFGTDSPSQQDCQKFVSCFVTYEERTRTVTVEHEDGTITEEEETYTVAVSIEDLEVIYQNIRSTMGVEATEDQRSNAESIYSLIRYGYTGGSSFEGADVPFIGADGFCSPIGAGWESRVTSEFGYRRDPSPGRPGATPAWIWRYPPAPRPGRPARHRHRRPVPQQLRLLCDDRPWQRPVYSLRPQFPTAGAGGTGGGDWRHRISVRQHRPVHRPPPPLRGARQWTENKPQILPANHIIRGVREYELNPEYGLPYCRL